MESAVWYTPEQRESVLATIVWQAEQDERVESCVLVGSGARGFADEFSDIDVCIVADDDTDVRSLADDWRKWTEASLSVAGYCLSVRAPDVLLHNFMLENYLEINMCILRMRDMHARGAHWRVLFDRTNSVEQRMTRSWEERGEPESAEQYCRERVAAIWHYVLHAYVAAKRERYWQAISDVEEIRGQTIRLRGLRSAVDTKRNRDVDGMDAAFRSMLGETLVASPSRDGVISALKAAVRGFFCEVRSAELESGLPSSLPLESKLLNLLP